MAYEYDDINRTNSRIFFRETYLSCLNVGLLNFEQHTKTPYKKAVASVKQ